MKLFRFSMFKEPPVESRRRVHYVVIRNNRTGGASVLLPPGVELLRATVDHYLTELWIRCTDETGKAIGATPIEQTGNSPLGEQHAIDFIPVVYPPERDG